MGTSLCCSICKVIDYVFIDKYSRHLKSSSLQFAFQAEHDTVICTSVVKEQKVWCVCMNAGSKQSF